MEEIPIIPLPTKTENDIILSEYDKIKDSLFTYQGEIYDKKESCKKNPSTCKDKGNKCNNVSIEKQNLSDIDRDKILYDLLVPYYFKNESDASSFKTLYDIPHKKTELFNSLYRTKLIKDELFTKLNENITPLDI